MPSFVGNKPQSPPSVALEDASDDVTSADPQSPASSNQRSAFKNSGSQKKSARFSDDASGTEADRQVTVQISESPSLSPRGNESFMDSMGTGDYSPPDSPDSDGNVERSSTWKKKMFAGRRGLTAMRAPHLKNPFSMGAEGKVQTVIGVGGFVGAAWFFTSSALLVLFGVQYDQIVVYEDQVRYASSAAERAAVNAAAVLSAGVAARDAIDYAVVSKLYFEPFDYAAVRAAVEPVFAGFPSLRSVDLAFDGSENYITVRRLLHHNEAVGSFMSMSRDEINVRQETALVMQSSAPDCTTLGERGCLSSANATKQRWFRLASGLWGGEEANGFRKAGDEVFRWDEQPGFVPRDPSRGGSAANVEWSAAYSLVFRSSFPGSSGKLSVVGRAVTDLAGLRAEEQLVDLELGPNGAIFVCDGSGSLLAAAGAGQQALAQKGGTFRFKKIGEVGAGWAQQLKDYNGKEQMFLHDSYVVAVQPILGRGLANFSAVVAAQRDMFIDERLTPMLDGAQLVAVIPYPVAFLTIMLLVAWRNRQRGRVMRRVHVLHEGMATLEHAAGGGFAGFGHETKLRQRTLEKSRNAQLAAAHSMSYYLENSINTRPKADAQMEKRLELELDAGKNTEAETEDEPGISRDPSKAIEDGSRSGSKRTASKAIEDEIRARGGRDGSKEKAAPAINPFAAAALAVADAKEGGSRSHSKADASSRNQSKSGVGDEIAAIEDTPGRGSVADRKSTKDTRKSTMSGTDNRKSTKDSHRSGGSKG